MTAPLDTSERLPNEPKSSPPLRAAVRPFYWSLRREIWENISIYVAPTVVAGIIILGCIAGAHHMPYLRRNALLLDPVRQQAAIERPYDIAAMMLIFTAFIAGVFYCLDALHGERRERSILFWKSLPVSDFTTVLSKSTIPLLVLPLVSFVIIVITQLIMLLISSIALSGSGLAGTTWANINLFQQSLVLLYALVVIALWHAPIYGWALLVSGWARRATFLWAVLPLLAIGFFEKITFGTWHFGSMLKERLLGFAPHAFVFHTENVASGIVSPGRYLVTPDLWIGLAFAIVFIAGAIRLRRYHGPL